MRAKTEQEACIEALEWYQKRLNKAKEGVTVRIGGGFCAEDMWYDEETYYGEEAKSQLNFDDYKAELERRRNTCTQRDALKQ